MKKLKLFAICAVVCFACTLIGLMYFSEVSLFAGRRLSGDKSFFIHYYAFVHYFAAGSLVFFIISVYNVYKKWNAKSAQEKKEITLKFRSNAVRERRIILLVILSFFLYGLTINLALDFDLIPKLSFLIIAGFVAFYVGGVAVFFGIYRKNSKRKLENAIQAQETISLKLRSIRSQLNPHFMFNALSSVQRLMNKNDIPAANHYLSMFADLTRKVLNTGEQELISLEDELKIQEAYLQMEQLRFGFRYEVKVGEDINIANTEIPVILLQPFVENAVKHGVAPLQQNGLILVQVNKQGDNLVLSVTDNGKGFDRKIAGQKDDSLGLKLSEERIALLNRVHPDQPAILIIYSKQTGTTITIMLINLFS